LNKIKLLSIVGVSLENIGDFFKAGAMGAGMGSTLFDKEMIYLTRSIHDPSSLSD